MAVRYFKDRKSAAWRGYQVWMILVAAARLRQTLTYGDLADALGVKGPGGVFAKILGRIYNYCLQEGLPLLTVIVVNKQTGRPGWEKGYADVDTDDERERVFRHGWIAQEPPTPEELGAMNERT